MIVTTAVLGPMITSFGLDVSTVIVNASLPSTIMSSGILMFWHTKVLTALIEEIARTSFPRRLKSLAPEIKKVFKKWK